MASVLSREPSLVIGTVVTALVAAYAKWRGLEVQDVLVQAGVLLAGFAAVRAKVTPYVDRVLEFRKGLHRDGDVDDSL